MDTFDAHTYISGKGDFNTEDENILMSLIKKSKATNVLDIGCGDGKLTARVHSVLPNTIITGIDNSQEQIAYAQATQMNLNFKVADIVDFKTIKKFDLIYSFYAFPHMPKSQLLSAFKSVRALLTNGAYFYLFTNICLFDTSMVPAQDQEACDIVFLDNWKSQINLVSLSEMHQLIKKAGFTTIENMRLKTGAQVKEYGDMISWLFILR